MKTKQRIINEAIKSYNTYGLSNISSRALAKSLQMSHGNLEYHYPNKESLVLAIYEQMREDVSGLYEGREQLMLNPIMHFHKLLIRLEEVQEVYSFFNYDILEISRKFPKVNKQIESTLQIRKTQMSGIFQRFIEMGYMKPEAEAGKYEMLQHSIRILITFWKPKVAILTNFDSNKKGEMTRHIWELITPHFTDKGMVEYRRISDS